jgi:hypothetical protein
MGVAVPPDRPEFSKRAALPQWFGGWDRIRNNQLKTGSLLYGLEADSRMERLEPHPFRIFGKIHNT